MKFHIFKKSTYLTELFKHKLLTVFSETKKFSSKTFTPIPPSLKASTRIVIKAINVDTRHIYLIYSRYSFVINELINTNLCSTEKVLQFIDRMDLNGLLSYNYVPIYYRL